MANRWNISHSVENEVRKRDANCVYCRVEFTPTGICRKSAATWEHILNDINMNSIENIALCCGSCNASKGNREIRIWFLSEYCRKKSITEDSVAEVVKNFLRLLDTNAPE